MKLLGTGLTGLVGSRFVELFENVYEFDHINLDNGINLLQKESVLSAITSSKAQVVIHMAAKTNVDGCEVDKKRDQEILGFKEEDREKAWISEQTAWAVNVLGTQNIVEACKKTGKRIVYISTDFVFDGKKRSYTEDDKPNPINWYAKTKYEGEKIVQNSELDYMIIRTTYPYRAFFERTDFVRVLISKLEKNENLAMVTDHIFRPTFIDDFANALDILIRTNQKGIFHVVGSQTVTPYDAAIKIAREFELDEALISKTTRREYFAGKAQRPFCLNTKNDKIGKLGIEMSTFDKGLTEIKIQMEKINI